jgi:phospholipid-translocating ATPase
MSIILRDLQNGKYLLFCKGADSAIFSKCTARTEFLSDCERTVEKFAHNGWRTLALAYRELTRNEYEMYDSLLVRAYNDIMDRNKKVADVFEEIESQLILLGATAIEDKLQEEVVETLQTLQMAGIKIWVLTGDKLETAINISQSCGHFTDSMEKLMLTNVHDPNGIEERLNSFTERFATKNY